VAVAKILQHKLRLYRFSPGSARVVIAAYLKNTTTFRDVNQFVVGLLYFYFMNKTFSLFSRRIPISCFRRTTIVNFLRRLLRSTACCLRRTNALGKLSLLVVICPLINFFVFRLGATRVNIQAAAGFALRNRGAVLIRLLLNFKIRVSGVALTTSGGT